MSQYCYLSGKNRAGSVGYGTTGLSQRAQRANLQKYHVRTGGQPNTVWLSCHATCTIERGSVKGLGAA